MWTKVTIKRKFIKEVLFNSEYLEKLCEDTALKENMFA